MNAVLKPAVPERSSEQAFFENQKLPPEKRGVTFEALFYKQLHNVTARIHDTENLEQIMLRPARTSASCSMPTVSPCTRSTKTVPPSSPR